MHSHKCRNNPEKSSRLFRDCRLSWCGRGALMALTSVSWLQLNMKWSMSIEKKYHSINEQIVCDASHRILDLVASWPEATHDARILRESGLFQLFEQRMMSVRCHLLGDSGYPGKELLLTPFLNPEAGPQSTGIQQVYI